jgi:hypothetical protein
MFLKNEDETSTKALTTGSTSTAARIAAYNASHPGDHHISTYENMINALGFQFMSIRADVPKYNNNVPLNGVSCLAAQQSDALPWWKLYLDSCAHLIIPSLTSPL